MEKRGGHWESGGGASGEQEGVGGEGQSTHPRLLQGDMKEGPCRMERLEVGEAVKTIFPMTLAAPEKKKKEKKIHKPTKCSIVQA